MKNLLTLGSDPEFIITDKDGCCVAADDVFCGCINCDPCEECTTRCPGNPIDCGICGGCISDCDDCNICEDCDRCRGGDPGECSYCNDCKEKQDFGYDTEIGCDGNSTVGELRPLYAYTPQEHYENIKRLVGEIDIPNIYEIRAGTRVANHSIGGHIHFGICDCIIDELVNYISQYAGIPLRKIEHEEDLKHRGYSEFGYGKFGSFNINDHGFEWRMPASWLVSSEIALAALSLTYVVVKEYKINPEIVSIPSIENQIISVQSPTTTGRLIGKIEKMEEYKKYSKEIEPLFQMLVNEKKWETNIDIRTMW